MFFWSTPLFLVLLQLSEIFPLVESSFLSKHVEKHQYDQEICKRSLHLYIEQFDPEKLYLLQEEAFPYLSPSQTFLEEKALEFQRKNPSVYEELALLIENSIYRYWELERECRLDLLARPWEEILSEEIQGVSLKKNVGHPSSIQEIQKKIRSKLAKLLCQYCRKKHLPSLDVHQRDAVLNYYLNRQREKEASYLNCSQQNHGTAVHAIKSIAASLDPHTVFLTSEEASEWAPYLTRNYCGVGVVLKDDVDGPYISRIVPKSSAEIEGQLQVGDLLLEIDHESVAGLSFRQVLKKMQGLIHTYLHLKLKREDAVYEVYLTREPLVFAEEVFRVRIEETEQGKKIVAISLDAFFDNGKGFSSASAIEKTLLPYLKDGSLKAVVLDLRNNGGGYLSQGSKVSALFSGGGVTLLMKGRDDRLHVIEEPKKKLFSSTPLVVLLSKASASAAEIVAQALQDYGVALIAGDEFSFGKGTAQEQTVTQKNSGPYPILVTTSRFYTISGRSNQLQGVKSDIILPTEWSGYSIGERFLPYPLRSDHLLANSSSRKSYTLYQHKVRNIPNEDKQWLKERSQERLARSSYLQGDVTLSEAINIANDYAELKNSQDKN